MFHEDRRGPAVRSLSSLLRISSLTLNDVSFMRPAERKLIASGSMRIRAETLRFFFHKITFAANKSLLQIHSNVFRTPGGCHLEAGTGQKNSSSSDYLWKPSSMNLSVNKCPSQIFGVIMWTMKFTLSTLWIDGILIACLGLTSRDLRVSLLNYFLKPKSNEITDESYIWTSQALDSILPGNRSPIKTHNGRS